MKKLFKCKLLSMLLALTLLFAGAVSLKPTQKANADETILLINDDVDYFLTVNLEEILFESSSAILGQHVCFVIDGRLFTNHVNQYTITRNTTLADLNNTMFFQKMAYILANKCDLGPLVVPNDPTEEDFFIDTSVIFAQINMDIVISVPNDVSQHCYRNILTHETGIILSADDLMDISSTTQASHIFGMLYDLNRTTVYTRMKLFQIEYYSSEFYTVFGGEDHQSLQATVITPERFL